jgi:hypothetical protein
MGLREGGSGVFCLRLALIMGNKVARVPRTSYP